MYTALLNYCVTQSLKTCGTFYTNSDLELNCKLSFQVKKYKFELQKAVNTPINAISAISGSHLRDKLQRVCALLSGQQVEVGGRKVSASDHPGGVAFCKDLFAKKIVVCVPIFVCRPCVSVLV